MRPSLRATRADPKGQGRMGHMDEPRELGSDDTTLPSGWTYRDGTADDPILRRLFIRFAGPEELERLRAAKERREASEAEESQ